MERHRIFDTRFGAVYPHYVTKALRKGRRREDLDALIAWLTGYDAGAVRALADGGTTFEGFFADAPRMNPDRHLITGVICGVRVEEIEEPLMREIRYLDKIVDELARGKAMEKIMRRPSA